MILLETLSADGFKGLRRLELRFPTDAAVLVEGANEAGKSTLFECVYFALYGSPLVTETSRGGPEETIGYGRDSCTVTLALQVGPARLEVTRTIRRGRPSQATLAVASPDRASELVQGVRAVNARIVEELGNLDGDALLNSCFVEQKKLSKLEDLTADKRRESLLRLLNLDRLGEVESSLRPSRADDQELTRARQRSELADVRSEIPRLRAQLAEAERALLALDVRRELAELLREEAAASEAGFSFRRAESDVAQVESLRHRVDLLDSEQEAVRLEHELADLEPRLRAAERRLAIAGEASRRFQAADALASWIRLRRSVALRERGAEELREAEGAVEERLGEYEAARADAAKRRAGVRVGAALAIAALALAALGFLTGSIPLAAIGLVGAAVLGALAWRQRAAGRAASGAALVAEAALTEARVQAQTIHGQLVAAKHLGGGPEELARCEATLAASGEPIPADEPTARLRHAELERRLVRVDRTTATAAQRDASASLEGLRSEREPLTARVLLLREGREPLDDDELAALDSEVERATTGMPVDASGSGRGRGTALDGEIARLRTEIGRLSERGRAANARCRELRAHLGVSLSSLTGSSDDWPTGLTWERVEATCPIVAEVAQLDVGETEARRNYLQAECQSAEGRATRLAGQVGLDGVPLDAAECRSEVVRLERLADVKRSAVEIVGEARRRMVARVLPNTERNFRTLLPRLTAGRYRDARIADDYRVEVWDEAAGRYVAKSIFSGGARDQFSLALRLAFALATLPEELGTSPGFLFLDEPLSSFDGERTQALVDLLTRGEIAASFRQIFVISHSRSFDSSAFHYRLVMAAGAVIESNLPAFGT
jgi:AAA domain